MGECTLINLFFLIPLALAEDPLASASYTQQGSPSHPCCVYLELQAGIGSSSGTVTRIGAYV